MSRRMIASLIVCAAITAATVQLPFLSDVIMMPQSNSSSITLTDRSCDQCLCESNFTHSILNCFPNNTCQFFVDAPRTYRFQPTSNALVYFPQQLLPKPSEGCMPNTSSLLNQLNTAVPTYANVTSPLCLLLDDHGYLVTLSQTDRSIIRFEPQNLTRIDQPPSPIFPEAPSILSHRNGAYYVGLPRCILVVHTGNMTILHNISTSELDGTRDMIFLNDGQQMIVVSTGNSRLLFFNRSSSTSYNYVFVRFQNVSCHNPHSLF